MRSLNVVLNGDPALHSRRGLSSLITVGARREKN